MTRPLICGGPWRNGGYRHDWWRRGMCWTVTLLWCCSGCSMPWRHRRMIAACGCWPPPPWWAGRPIDFVVRPRIRSSTPWPSACARRRISCRGWDCWVACPGCWTRNARPVCPNRAGCWGICSRPPGWCRRRCTARGWIWPLLPCGCGGNGCIPPAPCQRPANPTAIWRRAPWRW